MVVNPPRSCFFNIYFKVFTNLSSVFRATYNISEIMILDVEKDTHCSTEKYERHNQHRRVQDLFVFVTLAEEFLLLVVRILHDLFIQFVASELPDLLTRAREGAFVGETEASIDRNPYYNQCWSNEV